MSQPNSNDAFLKSLDIAMGSLRANYMKAACRQDLSGSERQTMIDMGNGVNQAHALMNRIAQAHQAGFDADADHRLGVGQPD